MLKLGAEVDAAGILKDVHQGGLAPAGDQDQGPGLSAYSEN